MTFTDVLIGSVGQYSGSNLQRARRKESQKSHDDLHTGSPTSVTYIIYVFVVCLNMLSLTQTLKASELRTMWDGVLVDIFQFG